MKVLVTPLIEKLLVAIDVFFFSEIDSKVINPRELIVHLHDSGTYKQAEKYLDEITSSWNAAIVDAETEMTKLQREESHLGQEIQRCQNSPVPHPPKKNDKKDNERYNREIAHHMTVLQTANNLISQQARVSMQLANAKAELQNTKAEAQKNIDLQETAVNSAINADVAVTATNLKSILHTANTLEPIEFISVILILRHFTELALSVINEPVACAAINSLRHATEFTDENWNRSAQFIAKLTTDKIDAYNQNHLLLGELIEVNREYDANLIQQLSAKCNDALSARGALELEYESIIDPEQLVEIQKQMQTEASRVTAIIAEIDELIPQIKPDVVGFENITLRIDDILNKMQQNIHNIPNIEQNQFIIDLKRYTPLQSFFNSEESSKIQILLNTRYNELSFVEAEERVSRNAYYVQDFNFALLNSAKELSSLFQKVYETSSNLKASLVRIQQDIMCSVDVPAKHAAEFASSARNHKTLTLLPLVAAYGTWRIRQLTIKYEPGIKAGNSNFIDAQSLVYGLLKKAEYASLFYLALLFVAGMYSIAYSERIIPFYVLALMTTMQSATVLTISFVRVSTGKKIKIIDEMKSRNIGWVAVALIILALSVLSYYGNQIHETKIMAQSRMFSPTGYALATLEPLKMEAVKSDRQYFRWTATIKSIGEDTIKLQEEGLNPIEAGFNYKFKKNIAVRDGEPITVSCKLSPLSSPSLWVMQNCRLEGTTSEDLISLDKYRNEYQKKIRESAEAKKKEELLQAAENEKKRVELADQEKAKFEATMLGRSLKQLGLKNSREIDLDVVDAIAGTNFVTMAVRMPEINQASMVVAIDRLRNQMSGSRFLIYFVTSKNYKIVNRRQLEHLVVAVYASTTGDLQILDDNGYVAKTISGI